MREKEKSIFLRIGSQRGPIWKKLNKYYPIGSGCVGHYFESSCDFQGILSHTCAKSLIRWVTGEQKI